MATARRAAAPTPEDFTRLPPDALRFLRALKRNNERAWFEEHRVRYEASVLAPLRALVEEMDVRLAGFAPEIVGSPKRSIFRIHRDIRFAKDKRPYKTHAAFLLYHRDVSGAGAAGRTMGAAGFYVHVEPGNCFVGGGIYLPPPLVLRALRDAIAEDPAPLGRVLAGRAFRERYGALDDERKLTRVPRGYAPDDPAAGLLRHRSFTAWHELEDDVVTSAELPDVLERSMRALLPLVRWANGVLGFRAAERR